MRRLEVVGHNPDGLAPASGGFNDGGLQQPSSDAETTPYFPMLSLVTDCLLPSELCWSTRGRRHCGSVGNNVLRHLPRVSAEVKPRAAMPWRDLPTFFSTLHQWPGPRCTCFADVLPKNCGDKWHVPASHMKSGEGRPDLGDGG